MARRSSRSAPSNDTEPSRGGDAGRSLWTGSISFGLLQIPVSLYTAEDKKQALHFRMLDKKDLSPIRLSRVNSSTNEPVEYKDIVKGYEYERDTFVVLDEDDLAKANVKATQTIDIQDFVPKDEIGPAHFDTPYYVVPQRRATKAYVLLRDALAKKGAVAVASFVLRTREHLCALIPVDGAIMLETLRFGHELKPAEDLPLPTEAASETVTAREARMAEELIDGMMTSWDPSKYRDRYYRDVLKLIDEKAKTGATKQHHTRVRGEVATDVVDLLDLLKKSIGDKGAPKRAKPRGKSKKVA